jgi:L-threonylcarbamoyladenylate synthase
MLKYTCKRKKINMIILKKKDLSNKNKLKLVAKALKASKLVIFPTETVYGLGANALDPKAAKKIYQAKGRPSDNPLIVHIANKNDVNKYTKTISKDALTLIEHFWPGPLTLIFKKNNIIPLATTGGLNTIAIRMPNHKTALSIIEAANLPIAAPSANLSGKPTSTKFKHVLSDFKGKVDFLIDGGDSMIGLESTVVDTTGSKITLLRPGVISKRMIESVIGKKIIDRSNVATKIAISPGMKYTHYKPSGEVIIIDASAKKMATYVNKITRLSKRKKVVVVCESEYANLFDTKTFNLGSLDNQKLMAHNLFSTLRQVDDYKADVIYIHHLGSDDLAYPIMNRLIKAAGYKVIKV